METTIKPAANRIDLSLARWRAQEQRYVQQFGNNVFNDRDFMKVRATAYRMIRDQHQKQKLNFEEKLDLRVLQGQMKQMNQRIYPNRYVRAGIGMLKFASRPIMAAGKLGVNILSYLVTGRPYFKTKKPSPHRQAPVRQLSSLPANKNSNLSSGVARELRKTNTAVRVLTDQENSQKIRR